MMESWCGSQTVVSHSLTFVPRGQMLCEQRNNFISSSVLIFAQT